jgi:restriction system protein
MMYRCEVRHPGLHKYQVVRGQTDAEARAKAQAKMASWERELSAHGGEVKVTQASRDGGVDAVAFDPDPIRGGKIIIQAKRYTNTVDVSSVRDLYGTVMSEGATKGVLVTTSSFGPDAHRFAKDKPITLMDGNNLLFLLAKHGHQARIDLAEAKRLGSALRR